VGEQRTKSVLMPRQGRKDRWAAKSERTLKILRGSVVQSPWVQLAFSGKDAGLGTTRRDVSGKLCDDGRGLLMQLGRKAKQNGSV